MKVYKMPNGRKYRFDEDNVPEGAELVKKPKTIEPKVEPKAEPKPKTSAKKVEPKNKAKKADTK